MQGKAAHSTLMRCEVRFLITHIPLVPQRPNVTGGKGEKPEGERETRKGGGGRRGGRKMMIGGVREIWVRGKGGEMHRKEESVEG